MPRHDFVRLFSLKGEMTIDMLASRKESVRDMYNRLSEHTATDAVPLGEFRSEEYDTYVLGDVVEKLPLLTRTKVLVGLKLMTSPKLLGWAKAWFTVAL